ncbi:MAG: aminotransferase class I/II-fold pyridoxal phosphate-dependent enzyme, partial [bacterium]|nr:aminotransferase class I/II-fold pyridoxal phosphate-dependent enzyme [bacterium]
PNNPTGLLSSRDELRSLLPHLPGIVFVDECYYELSGETLADVVCAYPNLILLRSLSKGFGLAGLRVGYAVASEGLIDRMARSALTFPVNCIAQAAALAALEDRELYHERVRRLVIMREELSEAFRAQGLEVLPSRTNFIMTFWPEGTSPASHLAEKGIWVSDQTKALASSRPALRIAVGSEEENQILLGAVRDLCS